MPSIIDRLDQLRADTPGTAQVAHFNHAGSSLPPTPVLQTVIDHLNLEATIGGYEAAALANEHIEASYASIARMLNATVDEIAHIENATRAWDMGAYSIPFQPGDRVLITPWEYSSNLIGILHMQKRFGLEIEVIPNDQFGQIDLDGLEEALRKPTSAVFITHMPTNGGLVQPAAEIGALIRRHQPDAWYVLDACQTAGQMPLNVQEIGCDILSVTSRKYLRGPRGAGFLYMRKGRIAETNPPLLDLHAAELTSSTDYMIRPDARRFENWESYVAGRLGLGAAVDYAMAVGLEAIWARVQEQGERLRNKLLTIDGVRIHDTGVVRGGIVTYSLAGVPSEQLRAELSARKINTSLSNIYRTYLHSDLEAIGTYIRASVHYITSDDEIDQLVAATAEVAR
ncbi:MAG: aminotransferase class V-fold PLP-dependent enzyme [Thermomicrobiales bacterium]|nr:aminotransferase class V-fold PLP-dependent enzyme [Thermomicrobiales bacterium]